MNLVQRIFKAFLPVEPQQYYGFPGEYSNMTPVRTVRFDGEKNPHELGDVLNVLPDHQSLRLRSHEANLKSDVVKIISNKFFKWVIGTGLKLQAQPLKTVLETEKINYGKPAEFVKQAEARFNLWAKSKRVDYLAENTLHKQANDCLKTSFLSGDVLVILRIEGGELNVQLVDGQQVQTPYFDDKHQKAAEKRGNTIRHGIEKDKRGRHVAYYVKVEREGSLLGEFERIEARGKNTGRKMAWMVYWDKHRIDHDRGIGALTPILEKVEKLDRYTEATVAGAEERAKLPYFMEHSRDSDGSNPMAAKISRSMGVNKDEIDSYSVGEKTVKNFNQTTSKMMVNMPIGAKISFPGGNTSEVNYKDFARAVFDYIAAALDVPPEVALQMYNSNYSASRAAINAFQHLLDVTRDKLQEDFYQPIYEQWLELEVLKSKITAPGYLAALQRKNHFAIEAYSHCEFKGRNIPHIDPAKEIKAIREMLGDDRTPLINREQAAEKANAGDWEANYRKYEEEIKIAPNATDKEQNREPAN